MKPFRTLLIIVTLGLGMVARSAEVPAPSTAPASSACQQQLTPDFVLMHRLPSITGPGACGAEDVVSLEAVLLNGEHIAFAPPPTLRCPMAEAVARWVRGEVAPAAAATFGSSVKMVITGTSYQCRGRDRDPAAKISEHGHANALDLLGLKLANGTVVNFTERATRKDFRENIRQSACATFTTVLGPGSDSYHENHIHLDLIERHGGYRVCQWDVRTVPEVPSGPRPPQRPRTSRRQTEDVAAPALHVLITAGHHPPLTPAEKASAAEKFMHGRGRWPACAVSIIHNRYAVYYPQLPELFLSTERSGSGALAVHLGTVKTLLGFCEPVINMRSSKASRKGCRVLPTPR